jgi:hypothetical protein
MASLTLADLTFTAADNCAVTDTTATQLTFDCDTPADQMITITVVEAIIKLMVMALEASAAVLKMVQARDQLEGNPIGKVFDNEQVEILKR